MSNRSNGTANKRPRLTPFEVIDLDEDPIPKKKPSISTLTISTPPKREFASASASTSSSPVQNVFVDKYKPKSCKEIVGQSGDKSNVSKLLKWLKCWYENREKEKAGSGAKKPNPRFATNDDGAGFKAVLLSGPPGIGKTTSAVLCCQEAGYPFKEMNASDTRSKKKLTEEIADSLDNLVLDGYFKTGTTKKPTGMNKRHVLIMDEVDGMAGNEDRGGIAEVIKLIKESKVPIICICNDRSHQKMRSLVNHCFDLRYYKPQVAVIKATLSKIAKKEGINISDAALDEIVSSSNQDIRQSINYLNMMGAKKDTIQKTLTKQQMKDVHLGPFDAIKKLFPSGFGSKKPSFYDKCDVFFSDYNMMPIMIFENYLKTTQPATRRTDVQKLRAISRSADALSFGDMIEKNIRTNQTWSLLPLQSVFSSAMPGHYMDSSLACMAMFPSYLGRISNYNKRDRLLQDLKCHMNLKISGTKTALSMDYLESLREGIIRPLKNGDIDGTVSFLNSYYIRKEDLDSIMELTCFSDQKDPYSTIDPKIKASLTRAINKSTALLPYSTGDVPVKVASFKGKKATKAKAEPKGKGKGKAKKELVSSQESTAAEEEEDVDTEEDGVPMDFY